ncbi:hypothetical protein ABIB96_001248 [Bradyrhizobium sp. LA3.X]|uniref:hypothetical protein n=1 Tax=unclassified Bradyrhizobium TaxID=2631580 RepID=UPI003398798D
MTHWWRAEDTSIDHPKLLKLSDAMFRAWYTLNCVASANDGALPPTEDVAIRLRMKPVKVAEWITKLVAAGLYDNDNGIFKPHNWSKRQYKSDKTDPTNAERQKRYRNRHRNDSNGVTDSESNDVTDKRPEQSRAETDSEQSRADARALDEIGLKNEAVLVASFTAVCASLGRKPPDMRQIATWLLDGIAIGTIQAAVTPILKRKADMASLAYCDSAVREGHAKAGVAPSLEPVPLTDDDWRATVRRFKANGSLWSRHAGPEPGMIGCRCPVHVLVEANIDPATGHDIGSGWHFVVEGTVEMAAFLHEAQSRKARPPKLIEIEQDGVAKRGFFSPIAVPNGYDEATGEKLAPRSEDAA